MRLISLVAQSNFLMNNPCGVTNSKYIAETLCDLTELVSRRRATSYHGKKKKKKKRYWGTAWALFLFFPMCLCHAPHSQGRSSHNEYYHISAKLHLSLIILLPSRTWTNIKGSCGILHSSREHYNLWSFPSSQKALRHTFPQPCFKIFLKHTQGFVAQGNHSARVKSETDEASCDSFGMSILIFSPSPFFSLMMHVYLPWARGGWCESGGRQPEPEITALCASMRAWLAALHKILFTAHTGEKLQQQSSSEAGKSADLATLRARPRGGSGTIIIILLLLIHCQYLYCSHCV